MTHNRDYPDDKEWIVEELYERYQTFAVKCADNVVSDRDPEEQDHYNELGDLFLKLAHRERDGAIPKERQQSSE